MIGGDDGPAGSLERYGRHADELLGKIVPSSGPLDEDVETVTVDLASEHMSTPAKARQTFLFQQTGAAAE